MTQHIKYECPKCKSENVDIITRTVGYFAKISNWNLSKIEELKHRRKGNYKINTNDSCKI